MTTALVSGGAGFIGSFLCEALIASGQRVVAVDNFVTGSRRNLAAVLDHPRFHLLEHDLTAPLPPLGEVSAVYHLASPASPVDYRALAIETLMVNATGSQHLLELARRHGARFLLASTSEVYGDPLVHPQVEAYWGNVNPVGDRSCYDEAKRFAEALTMSHWRRYGTDVRIVRIFNTYGPRMRLDDGRVVPNFLNQALQGQPLTIYGDGQQTRSFCYVTDLVAGLMAAMTLPGTTGEVFNLGNPEETTIRRFAEAVCALMSIPLQVEPRPLPPDDPSRRCPDIRKARTRLGWEPQVPLDVGLQLTSDYFRDGEGAANPCSNE